MEILRKKIEKFFDLIGLDLANSIDKRCFLFVEKTYEKKEWALNQIISFLQFEKTGRKREK